MKFICDCGGTMAMSFRMGKGDEPYTVVFTCFQCGKQEEYGA
jgi:hypothetical protein